MFYKNFLTDKYENLKISNIHEKAGKKSAAKNELHKFHAERVLNIHITYIFSAVENSNFEKG